MRPYKTCIHNMNQYTCTSHLVSSPRKNTCHFTWLNKFPHDILIGISLSIQIPWYTIVFISGSYTIIHFGSHTVYIHSLRFLHYYHAFTLVLTSLSLFISFLHRCLFIIHFGSQIVVMHSLWLLHHCHSHFNPYTVVFLTLVLTFLSFSFWFLHCCHAFTLVLTPLLFSLWFLHRHLSHFSSYIVVILT